MDSLNDSNDIGNFNNSNSSDPGFKKWGTLFILILVAVSVVTTLKMKLENKPAENALTEPSTETTGMVAEPDEGMQNSSSGPSAQKSQINEEIGKKFHADEVIKMSSDHTSAPFTQNQQIKNSKPANGALSASDQSSTPGSQTLTPSEATKNKSKSSNRKSVKSMQNLTFAEPKGSLLSTPSKSSSQPKKIGVSTNTPIETMNEKPTPRYKLPDEETVKNIRAQIKTHLRDALEAQRAYFQKYKRYSTDLNATGWLPRQPNLIYKAGFTKAYNSDDFYNVKNDGEDPKKMDTDFYEGTLFFHGKTEFRNEYYQYSPVVRDLNLSHFEKYCLSKCTANSHDFEMLLVAPLGSPKFVDVWTIDSRGRIRLAYDGSSAPLPNSARSLAKNDKPKKEEPLIDED